MNPNSNITKLVPVPILKPGQRVYSNKLKICTISCKVVNETDVHKKEKRKTNFYELLSLGSAENVGFEEIKKAYRSMALRYHPDVCPPSDKEQSTRRFIELQRAYETLSNPVSRKKYDYYELGLVEDHDHGVAAFGHDNVESFSTEVIMRRSVFPKEVWENQLSELKRRSQIRTKKGINNNIKFRN